MKYIQKHADEASKRVISDLLMADFLKLERDGVLIKGKIIKAHVFCIQGDNLGSHEIAGFVPCFNHKYFCRFCHITKEMFKQNPCTILPLRTPLDHKKCLKKIEKITNPKEPKRYKGVVFDSCFNSLKKFHVCNPGMPPCVGHDVFQGFADKDLSLIIHSLVRVEKWFSYETINRKILAFKFPKGENICKPVALKNNAKRLGGTASQNWTLIRYLPFILSIDVKNHRHKICEFYLQLKEVVEYCCAPSISRDQIVYFQQIIYIYLERRKLLFPNKKLIPIIIFCHIFRN